MTHLTKGDIVRSFDKTLVVETLTPEIREPTPPLPTGALTAEAVPEALKPQPMPLVRVLIPVVMVAAMLAMVAIMFLGQRQPNPLMLAMPLMMGASMLMMFAQPESTSDVDETRRTYLRHLQTLRELALANAQQQRDHMTHCHPPPAELHFLVDTRRLWERNAEDSDALEVRLGVGPADLVTPVDMPDPGSAEDLDPVCAISVRRTVRAVSVVADIPIAVQLRAFRFLGISGQGAGDLARAMIAHLVTLHGPETLGVEVVGDPHGQWAWLKWLPHTQAPAEASYRVLVVADLLTTGTESFIDDSAYTVIIDVGAVPTSALFQRTEAEGMAVIAGETLDVLTAQGLETLGTPDRFTIAQSSVLARRLTKYTRPDNAESGHSNDLLALLGIDDIERLSPATMWPGRELTRQRLLVPIGVSPTGSPVRLDLKEAAHGGSGPHGLCIGATGSGKSELLKTLVVALAATHSPEELNFVLVDFKGGATFLGCEGLPHTSAVITNLENEASLVERMYDAISGEMNRRQGVLREAGNFANITDYTAARLGDNASGLEALPALLIIVDEFSELLSAHPDFADLFVAVGRLGRSLGVHLLLASQRLEEGKLRGLDSHLSYRIGLKTFSTGESRQVLGVPDAHHLPSQPGAGYLRTGAETLTRFQAAYVSGPLERREMSAGPAGNFPGTVTLFEGWEQYRTEAIPVRVDSSTTLLDAVVNAARTCASDRGLQARQIWLPPLPERVPLSDIVSDTASEGQAHLAAAVGIIDRPYHQAQDTFVVELGTGGGHLAVSGGPQTGKTMTLRTAVATLAATHTTADTRFYIIDFGTSALADLARLPHVAGYADRSDPTRIRRIVQEVMGLVTTPEERSTFLVIDGWHAIAAADADFVDLQDTIGRLAADGPSARVHLMIATPRWTILRPAIRDLISHRIELRLTDALDSLIDRKAQEKLVLAPGRGLTMAGENMLIAYTAGEDIAHISARAAAAGQEQVPQLRVLPERIEVTDLDQDVDGIAFAVGGEHLDAVAWDPSESAHFVCVGASGSGKSTLIATLIHTLCRFEREDARLVLIDQRRAHLGTVPEEMLAAYAGQSAATSEAIDAAVTTLTSRLPSADITSEELKRRSWWTGPEIFVIIDDADVVSEHDLMKLVPLLPHARDIGMHVVVARKSGGVSRSLFGGFLGALKDEQPAVVVLDADKDDGPIFGVKTSRQPPGRGTFLSHGSDHGLIQVAVGP